MNVVLVVGALWAWEHKWAGLDRIGRTMMVRER